MENRYDTYCGLYCDACMIMAANKNKTLESLAQKWNRPVAQLECSGCKSGRVSVFCRQCVIKNCAQTKAVEFCFECPEYPCPQIVAFNNDEDPHHSVVLKSLDNLKSIGLAQWLSDQDRRWRCSGCGTRFSWYEKTCTQCGQSVYNAEEEEKDFCQKKA
ncbi:MAG: DUF3795 domain-containing protein [Desulfobacteraceae bacterium]|nr:MAG: DUF3795 domain-containing protein [Desulfobacteraceae bacterium]